MFDRSGVVDIPTLARTYEHRAYPDMWGIVEQYIEVMDYASRHPDSGSTAVASRFDLPRGRVRTWLDGGAPDVIRGLEAADRRGWLGADFGDRAFTGLNALVANVFSGGSIAEDNYSPRFALNHQGDDSHVFDALELAGVDYDVLTDRPDRADEIMPTTDGAVLGRVLTTLGAPVGPKGEDRPISLPAYLAEAPAETRETFVYAYLENRAIQRGNRYQFREQRPDAYLDALAQLIADVADGQVTRNGKNIHISSAASENLGQVV